MHTILCVASVKFPLYDWSKGLGLSRRVLNPICWLNVKRAHWRWKVEISSRFDLIQAMLYSEGGAVHYRLLK